MLRCTTYGGIRSREMKITTYSSAKYDSYFYIFCFARILLWSLLLPKYILQILSDPDVAPVYFRVLEICCFWLIKLVVFGSSKDICCFCLWNMYSHIFMNIRCSAQIHRLCRWWNSWLCLIYFAELHIYQAKVLSALLYKITPIWTTLLRKMLL